MTLTITIALVALVIGAIVVAFIAHLNGYRAGLRAMTPTLAMRVMQDDIADMLRALGIPDAARAESPHRVVQRLIIPAIHRLVARRSHPGSPETPLWRCSRCGYETADGEKISNRIMGINYLTCPRCMAVGEFVDADPPPRTPHSEGGPP
jgi:DNA-directed RNA polymerase subunit RPC12/RpoP